MTFSNPASNKDASTYQAVFTHTNGIQVVIDRFDLASDSADESDSDVAVAAAIAALSGSPDFTFASGSKIYQTVETWS